MAKNETNKTGTRPAGPAPNEGAGNLVPEGTVDPEAGMRASSAPGVLNKAMSAAKSVAQTIAATIALDKPADGTVTLVYPTGEIPGCLVLNAAPGATFDASQTVTVAVPVEDGRYESIVVAGNRIK